MIYHSNILKKRIGIFGCVLILLVIIFSASGAYAQDAGDKNILPDSQGDDPRQNAPLQASHDNVQSETSLDTSAGEVILINQLNHMSDWGVVSENFQPSYSNWDTEAADDFIVPVSDGTWLVETVDVYGFCRNLYFEVIDCGSLASANVYIYRDNGLIPGENVYTAELETITTGTSLGSFVRMYTINLSTPTVLPAGTYWISVQVNMDISAGDWLWNERVVQNGDPYAFRNPGGAWGEGCTSWCSGFGYDQDLNFRLGGIKGNPYKVELSTGEVYGVAEHSSQPLLYASLPQTNAVAVINTDTETVVTTIPVGSDPQGIAISPDNNTVYVALNGGSAIKVIDTGTNTVSNTFSLSYQPVELAYGGPGRLYVSDGSDIEILDPSSGSLVSTLPSSSYAGSLITISPDGQTLCSSRTGISPASLACYDISTDSPPAPWTEWNIGGNLQTIDISGDNSYLYSACGAPYQINAYNLSTLTQAGQFDTGAYPASAYDSYQGDKVFISGGGSSWAWDAQTYLMKQILDHQEVKFLGSGRDNVTAYATDDNLLIYHFTSFQDLSWTHWARNWIEGLYQAGLTSGYPDGTYRPENPVTRAEMAVFLLGGMGISPPAMDGSHPFSDIAGHWAEAYIEELYDQGVTGGYPDGTYRPQNNVTRAEMAIFLLKGMGVTPPPIDGSHPFSDIAGHWAEIFIEELYDQGVTGGYPDGTYRPQNQVTRAEMAVFLVNAFNLPLP